MTLKLPVKLVGLEAYQDIKHSLLKAVHDSMTVEVFEEKWNHTITSHHLEENEWLAKLYEERERSCISQFQFLCGNVVNPTFGINECLL